MATGTCTVHSWNDGANSDEADYAPMGISYNDKLQVKDHPRPRARGANSIRTRSRGETGGLRSHVVRPRRHGYDDGEEDDGSEEDDQIMW